MSVHEDSIRAFVTKVLPNVPHDKNVTLRFFEFVAHNPGYFRQYSDLRNASSKDNVNQVIGRLIPEILGLPNNGRMQIEGSLIKSYTMH